MVSDKARATRCLFELFIISIGEQVIDALAELLPKTQLGKSLLYKIIACRHSVAPSFLFMILPDSWKLAPHCR
jgi:hypothetical protein